MYESVFCAKHTKTQTIELFIHQNNKKCKLAIDYLIIYLNKIATPSVEIKKIPSCDWFYELNNLEKPEGKVPYNIFFIFSTVNQGRVQLKIPHTGDNKSLDRCG